MSHPSSIDEDCPIPATHRRLNDLHQRWHEALEKYFDPDAFRLALNSLIQESRNVTFVLQSEKDAIPGFDDWYGKKEGKKDVPGIWQRRMMADPVAKWANDARVQVTKRGELETLSYAKATVLVSWMRQLVSETRVPPGLPMEAIVEFFLERVPAEIRETGVLRVERRWVAETLPDHEVLDALAHCYGVLACIVKEAHEMCGARYVIAEETPAGLLPSPVGHLDGRLPCMVMNQERRTISVNLRTRQMMTAEEVMIPIVPSHVLSPADGVPKIGGPDDFLGPFGRWLLESAKQFLSKHGQLLPLYYLVLPDNSFQPRFVVTESWEDKLLVVQHLAVEVMRMGAWGIAAINESWFAPFDPAHPNLPPSESPDRKEAICVEVATNDGRVRSYMVQFHRVGDRIQFDEAGEDEDPKALHLAPILEVWRGSRE